MTGFLNGTHMRHIFSLSTLVAKFLSCVMAIGCGMPVGPEGPMIHLGSVTEDACYKALGQIPTACCITDSSGVSLRGAHWKALGQILISLVLFQQGLLHKWVGFNKG